MPVVKECLSCRCNSRPEKSVRRFGIGSFCLFQLLMVMIMKLKMRRTVTWTPLLEIWKIYSTLRKVKRGEESNMPKNDKLDGIKCLKMRRQPSQVETDEDVEDEATEYAELCRLLMKDEEQKKKKKMMKGVGEGMGSFPPPRPSIGFQNNEPVRKTIANDKKPTAIQPDASFLVNENTVKDTRNVDSPIIKIPKGKQVKESNNSLGLRKVKILNDNLKVFKEKKSARENYVCGACGQHGHMRTNKHCPRNSENTESQTEGRDMEKSVGKPSSSELSGQAKLKPIKNSKVAPKSAMKVSVDEAPKGDNSTLKTGVLPLRFRCGIPAGAMSDKPGSEAPASSEQAPVSDIDTRTKLTSKISKLKISRQNLKNQRLNLTDIRIH